MYRKKFAGVRNTASFPFSTESRKSKLRSSPEDKKSSEHYNISESPIPIYRKLVFYFFPYPTVYEIDLICFNFTDTIFISHFQNCNTAVVLQCNFNY